MEKVRESGVRTGCTSVHYSERKHGRFRCPPRESFADRAGQLCLGFQPLGLVKECGVVALLNASVLLIVWQRS